VPDVTHAPGLPVTFFRLSSQRFFARPGEGRAQKETGRDFLSQPLKLWERNPILPVRELNPARERLPRGQGWGALLEEAHG
jgi:hypothetical protein